MSFLKFYKKAWGDLVNAIVLDSSFIYGHQSEKFCSNITPFISHYVV